MSELLVAGVDLGASNMRAGVFTDRGELVGWERGPTRIDDYDASIEWIADTLNGIARREYGSIGAASIAVAAEIVDGGRIGQAEDLTPWRGQRPGYDLGVELFDRGHIKIRSDEIANEGTDNDMKAIARSQMGVNRDNGRGVDGTVVTWSSGFNAANFTANGNIQALEEGHEYLRPGATCGCGEDGHVGAHISGNGIDHNTGTPMSEWLDRRGNQDQIVTDVSTAIIAMLERHRAEGHTAKELRWTGSVALNHPDLLHVRVAGNVRRKFGGSTPAFETVTMGDLAGMHGAAVRAREILAQR